MVILATISNFQKLMIDGCDVETFCFNRYSKEKVETFFYREKAKIRIIVVKTIYLLSRT
jgi:hypothetical protein